MPTLRVDAFGTGASPAVLSAALSDWLMSSPRNWQSNSLVGMHLAQPTAFALAIASLASCSLITDFDSGFREEGQGGSAGYLGVVAGSSGAVAEQSKGGSLGVAGAAGATTYLPPGTVGIGGSIGGSGSAGAGQFGSGGVQLGSTTWPVGGAIGAGAPGTVAGGGIAGATGSTDAGLSLAIGNPIARVPVGQSGTIDVSIQRQGGVGAVDVSIQGLPSGVAAATVTIPPEASTAQLTIQVASSAKVGGPYACTIEATSKNSQSVTSQTSLSLYLAGRSGFRDDSFGATLNGTETHVTPAVPGEIANMVVDGQGHIALCGSYWDAQSNEHGWLTRLTLEGALDAGFASTGLYTDFGTPPTRTFQVAANQDRLYISATNANAPYLRRLLANGSHDPAFGIGGDAEAGDGLAPLIAFKDGTAARTVSTGRLYVFAADGTRDSGFPEVGIDGLAADSQNRLVVTQSTNVTSTFRRILSSGTVDPSFGTLGETTITPVVTCASGFETSSFVSPLVASDSSLRGLFSCYGNAVNGIYQYQYVLVGLDAAGQVDRAFGTDGFVTVSTSPREVIDAFVQSDGKVVLLLGEKDSTKTPIERSYLLTRLSVDGSVDATFGVSGLSRVSDYLYAPSPFASPCTSGKQTFCASHLRYDQKANRAVIAGWIEGVGLGVMRFWL